MITASYNISSSYLNTMASYWEPIIEKCSFDISVCHGAKTNPKNFIHIDLNKRIKSLNFNCSIDTVNLEIL